MALHRGIQSALFYYISCAPCAEARYKRKRRKQAEEDREEKRLYEELNPGLYRHPSPFATNPNWQVEIDLGPGRSSDTSKKGKGRNDDALRSVETMSSVVDSHAASSPDFGGRNDSRLTVRQFQREDEELWGSAGNASTECITRPPTARTNRTGASSRSYQSMRNPDLNDLHPATVTRLDSIEDVAWMLQPPPPAKVMSGQMRASRSRSDSGASKISSRKGDETLARQVSERLMAEKRRKAETLELPVLSRGNSASTVKSVKGGPPVLRLDYSSSEDGDREGQRRRTRKSRPVNMSEGSTNSANTVLVRRPRTAEDTTNTPRAAARPDLDTISSQSPSPTSVSPHTRSGRKRNLTTSAADSVAASVSRGIAKQMPSTVLNTRSAKIDGRELRVLQERPSNAHLSHRPRTAELQKSPSFLESSQTGIARVDKQDAHYDDDYHTFGTAARRQDSKGCTLVEHDKASDVAFRGRNRSRTDHYDSHRSTSRSATSGAANMELDARNALPSPLPYGGKDSVLASSNEIGRQQHLHAGMSPGLSSAGLGSAAKDLHGILDMDLEGWYEWASRTVQRRVSKRWSMDI